MRSIRRALAALALALSGGLAAGCGLAPAGGMADRCADIMERADPGAKIDITTREASATALTTIVAKVEGVRKDMPRGGPLPRDLAVECRFDDGVLTGFRWTAGPLR